MASISWDDSLLIRIPEIDHQHEQLVAMLDHLSDAMIQGRSHQELRDVLNALVDYARVHFAEEEQFFARVRYPATAGHIAQHRSFIGRVTEFRSRSDQGAVGVSTELLGFLETWLIRHIRDSDGAFGVFYAEATAGVSSSSRS
jgi:hemerythrin